MNERLKRYSALAASTATFAAHGQIVYTDVVPDVTLNTHGAVYFVDMNGIPPSDFMVGQGLYSSTSFIFYYNAIIPIGSGSYGSIVATTSTLSATSTYTVARGFSSSNMITSSMNFSNSALILGVSYVSPGTSLVGGDFLGTTKFAGVRFDIGGNFHYGWIRLSVSANANAVTIHDYAYEATPNTPIHVIGGIGINEPLADNISLIHTNDLLIINYKDTPGVKDVRLLNLAGQPIIAETCINESSTLSLDDIASGIYMVQVIHETGTWLSKLYVK